MAAALVCAGTAGELAELIRLGEAAAPHDPKLAALLLEIRLIRLDHPAANILVYTEYTESQRAAAAALASVDGVVLTISGADSDEERSRAAERFAEADGVILVSTDSLAEGLNLHQRCFHLIHLDLPYNPNRLEQRNGRIDRYGQRTDPQIRYLYFTGTFEERLLLRLIAKYEKARACLSFMPNTLGVTAAPASLHEPLLSGFAEDLFSALPRLIHSLDLTAEDADSEAYRDLLKEIDRAFQSFDHAAVRHGWLSGGELGAAAAPEPAGDIDLPAFVASVLTGTADGYRVPVAWTDDLDGLPGFDRMTRTVRLTSDPGQLRDAQERTLLYPGRSHPLTRRAIATVRTRRVSAARAGSVSLLLTYAVQAGSWLRRVLALRLSPDGSVEEQPDFLALAETEVAADGLWAAMFADWAPAAMATANDLAVARAHRIGAAAATDQEARCALDVAAANTWLGRRADELCGAVVPLTGDLFGSVASIADWRTAAPSERRLAAFAADPSVAAGQRRDAAEALSRWHDMTKHESSLSPPSVRPLGMLMLVP